MTRYETVSVQPGYYFFGELCPLCGDGTRPETWPLVPHADDCPATQGAALTGGNEKREA